MTWAEFLIRSFAYQRTERKAWFKVREVAWAALIGSHFNPKKLPKTKEQFIPLNPKATNKRNEQIKARIKQAQNEYYNKLELLNNGKARG